MRHSSPSSSRLRLARLLLPLGLVAVAWSVLVWTRAVEAGVEAPLPAVRTLPYRPAAAVLAAGADLVADDVPVHLGFRPGETVGQVLDGLGLGPVAAGELIAELAEHADLRRIRPEDSWTARRAAVDGRVTEFQITLAGRGRARVVSREEGWRGSWRPFERRTEVRTVSGRLDLSLEASVRTAGADPRLAYGIADLFQWDLDFNRDPRTGDRFEALFEEVYLDGGYQAPGAVFAAVYENQGRRLESYRFGDPPGYYDAEGRPMRKMFLRSPLAFSRVTSGFSSRRFHPILKRYRPHYGVDYGAPTGTPVRATASGVVMSAGWLGGGGRTVKLRHPNGYLTAYLHLSRFAGGLATGRRVAQGEVIGYVGSSGLSTASHLDYRVQRDGRWIDPLSLKSVPTQPLPESLLAEFGLWRDAYRSSLESGAPFTPPPPRPAGDGRLASAEPAADLPADEGDGGR